MVTKGMQPFSMGDNEASDWLRNCVADEVLLEGWHLLHKDRLISLEEIKG